MAVLIVFIFPLFYILQKYWGFVSKSILKRKKWLPKNGSRIKIHYAHLGYYKKLQIDIYSKKDFEVN